MLWSINQCPFVILASSIPLGSHSVSSWFCSCTNDQSGLACVVLEAIGVMSTAACLCVTLKLLLSYSSSSLIVLAQISQVLGLCAKRPTKRQCLSEGILLPCLRWISPKFCSKSFALWVLNRFQWCFGGMGFFHSIPGITERSVGKLTGIRSL